MIPTVYSLDEISRYLPAQDSSIAQPLQKTHINTPELKTPPSPSSLQIALAVGIIILLGSIFATLAAHQIVPTGLNAFNQLHPGSYMIGYGLLTIGFIIALVSAVKWWQFNKLIEIESWRWSSQPIEYDEYAATINRIQRKLADNEMLAISAKLWGVEQNHILTKNSDYTCTAASWEDFWKSSPSEEDIVTYTELLASEHFVTLEELAQRA